MSTYYNENDPQAAAWLRELIAAGEIPGGWVDERSIEDVRAGDVVGYHQCHWFAGIGGWPLALRLAGWPDDRPVWTGSPPCQPFSNAGRRGGYDDKRHLAPAWLDLISQCRPQYVIGEQVTNAVGKAVPQMRSMEAIQRLLRELVGGQAISLQQLQTMLSRIPKRAEGTTQAARKRTSAQRQSDLALANGKAAGRQEWPSVHDNQGSSPGDAKSREVCSHWHPIRHGGAPWLGDAIARPDHAESWLYAGQHADGPLLRERDDEGLGRGQDTGDSGGDAAEAAEALARLAAEVGIEADGAASGKQWTWLDDLQDALEAEGYATGAVVLPACSVGAPHIRQRLWFVAHRVDYATSTRYQRAKSEAESDARHETWVRVLSEGCAPSGLGQPDSEHARGNAGASADSQGRAELRAERDACGASGASSGVADAECGQRDGIADSEGCKPDRAQAGWQQGNGELAASGELCRMADAEDCRRQGSALRSDGEQAERAAKVGSVGRMEYPDNERRGETGHSIPRERAPSGRTASQRTSTPQAGWDAADWLYCRDGRWRPVKPGLEPLVDGIPRGVVPSGDPSSAEYADKTAEARVMRLKGYGNAIVPQVAAEVVRAFMDSEEVA